MKFTPLTKTLADQVCKVRVEDIPESVLEVMSHVVLDGIAVMVAGTREPSGIAELLWGYSSESGARGVASVIGGGFRTDAQSAAFANGSLGHALDFDNTWWPVAHPTSSILPAVLAVAEARQLSGQRVMEALVAGFEVHGRLRLATEMSPFGVGFHRNGVAGIMGAVAAVGRLTELSADELATAFGVAGSRAGSMSSNTGTMTKPASAGHAARMGIESARLAEIGFTAHCDIFGTGGYLDLFFGVGLNDSALLVEGFANPFRLVSPGIGFKKYPCNYFTHRAIDAVRDITQASGPLREPDIRAVRIIGPRFDYIDRNPPKTGLEAKFSLQYVTAVAALDGEVTLNSFSDEQLLRPEVRALLGKTAVLPSDEISLDFRYTWTQVEIDVGDRTLVARCDIPRGMWGHPLSRQERLDKVRDCLGSAWSAKEMKELVRLTETLVTSEGVESMMNLVGVKRAVSLTD